MTQVVREPDHTRDYRSAARRLRARHGSDPARLQRSLRALCDRVDRARPRRVVVRPVMSPVMRAPGPAEAFGDMVAARMDGPVLRYSQRAALIRTAQHAGIGRFEANLVIAAVEHRTRSRSPQVGRCRAPMPRFASTMLIAVTLQLLIALFAWWTLG